MKQTAYMHFRFTVAVQTAKKSRPPLTAANRRCILSVVNDVHVGG